VDFVQLFQGHDRGIADHAGIIGRGLTKRFGTLLAVDHVDLDFKPGAVVGFLGHNGAGKTTTMRMLCGVLPPTAGDAFVGGFDLQSNAQASARVVGYLPEGSPLYPELRVREYLGFRAKLYGVTNAAAAIESAIDRCGLVGADHRIIGQLSKGFRQRVGLAASILHDPKVLILDEPTSGLDPLQVIEVRALIASLAADRTILLSTHVLSEAEAICDQIVLMARGRIIAQGNLSSLRAEVGSADASLETLFVEFTARAFSVEKVAT
jgi:ABC-2 type transport system ATP-binding protein